MVSLEKAILYLLLRENEVSVERLIKVLRGFKESEASVRTALSRLKREEYIKSIKRGKKAFYSLTDWGMDKIVFKRHDIPVKQSEWDGQWHIVTFDIPERFRYRRDILRKKLLSLGYGTMHTSVMISPYDRGEEIKRTVKEYEIEDYVEFFTAKYQSDKDISDLISKIWDFKWLERQYHKFISVYGKELEDLKTRVEKGEAVDTSYAFLKGVELNESFYRIVASDPRLPEEFLPVDWAGFKAARIYDEYLQILEDMEKEK
jgi:phenylacetic acid degradation operon negative regulatory protein